MTKTDSIDKLINRLTELQLEQARTIQRIAELRREEEGSYTLGTEVEDGSIATEHTHTQIPTVISSVRTNDNNYSWTEVTSDKVSETFTEGTRVYILNRVTKLKRGKRDEKDHRATVERIEQRRNEVRVYFRTDNGVDTWRLAKHLGLLHLNNNKKSNDGKRRR